MTDIKPKVDTNFLKNNYLWLTILILVVGLAIDFWASTVNLVSQKITAIDHGIPVEHETITYPDYVVFVKMVAIFLYTLSASLFISVFVTENIETSRANQREMELKHLSDAVNINVFDSLFKTIIPSEIFEVIKQEIVHAKIIRRDAQWLYDFSKGDNDTILFEQTIISHLHNNTNEPVVHSSTLTIGDHDGKKWIQSTKCTLKDQELFQYNDANPTAASNVTIRKEGDHLKHLEFSVTIPSNQHIVWTIVTKSIYESGQVNDFYATRVPLINAQLIVTFPTGYVFDIFQSLSTKMKVTWREPNRIFYELKGAVLPNQGFVFYLTKSPASTSELKPVT